MANTPEVDYVLPTPKLEEMIEINSGFGDDTKVWPRLPRFEAHDIARYV